MACCHKVMILLDTAGGAARHSSVRGAALRLLTYLSCRFGLARVHWAFKFFDSQGARSRPSRVSDFRELGPRSWEEFEEELEARLGDLTHSAHLPGPAPRATHTHGALMETLLDYQWDRPEITSPTKPFLRSSGRRLLDVESEAKEAESALGGFVNAVFLFAPCPHSHRELLQFVSGCEAQRLPPNPKQVMEKVLPKTVQEVMKSRKITLYWVDTTDWLKLWDSPDRLGFQTVCERLQSLGGTVLPSEPFSQNFPKTGQNLLSDERKPANKHLLSPWISTLPTDSSLNCMFYNSCQYEASFPRIEGMLFLPVKGKEIQETCVITLEPLTMHQSLFQNPVKIVLKGTATQWTLPVSSTLTTDSWMLQSPERDGASQSLFQQLANRLIAEQLYLVVSVDPCEGWPPSTGVISPFSSNATVLTVFRPEEAEFQTRFLQTVVAESPQETSASLFRDITDDVLKQIENSPEDATSPASVPEWAQQELSRNVPWSATLVEKWFPFSNLSGASSDLMESFWLLQASSANKEEPSKTENELTRHLSEFYQRKTREESAAANQEDSKRKRSVPRTPVRRKMNSMCRSLKMLNVARFNVKAQKFHPDGSPDAVGEKRVSKTAAGRTADRSEDRARTLRSSKAKDFKTEEDLLSYIHESYQKAVTTDEISLFTCAQNLVSTFKTFLKSKGTEDLEMKCLDKVKDNLLKTSKSLRQNLGKKLDKKAKVIECQLQVFLRLEMCLQCPLLQESTDEAEQLVEEVAELLRMVSLTEDPAYLAKFLEEILGLYTDSIPRTLGSLYHCLGFQIPQKLAGALPTDFFSDDSMTQESKSPDLSVPPAHKSMPAGTESDQLEELRTRSAKKRRKNALIRHKSLAEVSQALRQIEIPKVPKKATKNENSHSTLQQPPLPVKERVQEVTKVRRNLFNQGILSPSKKSLKRGLPRSHSVSAVEGLEYKPENFRRAKDYHKLLTKSVAETPEHKQISKRLLHRQIQGRSSDPGPDIRIVEESPEKGENELNLRRSPRIKQLLINRTYSEFFYSASQPKSRSVQRVHSFQNDKPGQRENSPVQSIRSPKSLLFGAVSGMTSPSQKDSSQIKRPSRNIPGSEIPTAYQTPKKNFCKPPSTSQDTQRLPQTPQTPCCTPERRPGFPVEMTPAKRGLLKEALRNSPSSGCDSSAEPTVTPQKGYPEEMASPSAKKIPRTPRKPAARPPNSPQTCALSQPVPSSPDRTSFLASSVPLAVQTRSGRLAPVRHTLKTPSKSAALGPPGETAVVGTHQNPGASQAAEPGWTLKEKSVRTPQSPESVPAVSCPAASLEELFTAPSCEISKSPLGKSLMLSPPSGEQDEKMPQNSSCVTTSLSHSVPCTPPKISGMGKLDTCSLFTPPKAGKRYTNTSDPQRRIRERRADPMSVRVVPTPGEPMATADCRGLDREGHLSAASPRGRFCSPGPGLGSEWRGSAPLLAACDADYLTLLEENEHASDSLRNDTSPELREALRTVVTDEQPFLSHPGASPSPSSSGSSYFLGPSSSLHHAVDRKQGQAVACTDNQQSLTFPAKPSSSPQTYEVELEMQASGLPKLRIKKKMGLSTLLDSEALNGPPGVDTGPGLSTAPDGRHSGRSENSYMSPPCLRSSHSTPGKNGGQTYICQSCTPTRSSFRTPSPLQTEAGVPWTPSPKHNGKTPPDTIKDWPRRKRAVDCSGGSSLGRAAAEGCTDPPASGAELELEGKERSFELGTSKTHILGDFELEGVCQLPDQSPPRDSMPKVEVTSRGQFGLGSRKRCLSAKEEAKCWAKRARDRQRGDTEASGEWSPGAGMGQLPSIGDEEVFLSGTTPPSSGTLRGCLSASGLQALTQSPLLFQGMTPSQYKDPKDEDTDVFPSTTEDSPFSQALTRRRPISRTYTRKKQFS
ncbi:PREDICTED: treslin [Elephantulus edwardii]|uniref:treslin n=1 Tax=Elephantulus edwardii TaxID=28737 RepID=UPI0003F0D9F6|nr:PREDICTED: treslin [Elephantulus edwardii]